MLVLVLDLIAPRSSGVTRESWMSEVGRGQDPATQCPSDYDSDPHSHLVSFLRPHKLQQIGKDVSPKHLNMISCVHPLFILGIRSRPLQFSKFGLFVKAQDHRLDIKQTSKPTCESRDGWAC